MGEKKRIVIIDDEISICKGCELCLKNDYDIYTFLQASLALSYIKNNGADLVITDLNLPNGVSGTRLVSLIQQEFAIPVIIMTGNHEINDLLGMKFGKIEVLYKPFTLDDLLKKVQSIFRIIEN